KLSLHAALLHDSPPISVSRIQFWMFVPQVLSLGTSFEFSCHKTCLMEPILDFRAGRPISRNDFWVFVPQDYLMERLLGSRATRTVSPNQFWIFVSTDLSLGSSFGHTCHRDFLSHPICKI